MPEYQELWDALLDEFVTKSWPAGVASAAATTALNRLWPEIKRLQAELAAAERTISNIQHTVRF